MFTSISRAFGRRAKRSIRKAVPACRLELEGLEERMVLSPISDKYWSLGGPYGFLGQPLTPEYVAPDRIGHYEHFQGGSIYWSPATAAHEIHGAIRDEWAHLG